MNLQVSISEAMEVINLGPPLFYQISLLPPDYFKINSKYCFTYKYLPFKDKDFKNIF